MKYVIDTSIVIDELRGGGKLTKILKHFDRNGDGVTFYVPTIVIFELFAGKSTRNVKSAQKIHHFIKTFARIELTAPIAQRAGELSRDGVTLDIPDYIIAASALEIGGIVVTLNAKHFVRVPGLMIYE